MKRLSVLPLLLILLVVTIPVLFGDHPVRWSAVVETGGDLLDRGTHFGPGYERYPVTPVARPWAPGQPQLGVQVYWVAKAGQTERQTWEDAQRLVNYVVSLGSNSVAISFPIYSPGVTSNEIGPGPDTPSTDQLAQLLHQTELAGLRTTLRPLLDEKSLRLDGNDWRGSIRPDSPEIWFANYTRMLTPYLQLAERESIASVTIGVEFNSMEESAGWRNVEAAARAIYKGELGYDANWDKFLDKAPTPEVDATGVDVYFPVQVPDDAGPDAIVEAWNKRLDEAEYTGPLDEWSFTEVGIVSRKGAFRSPSDFYRSGTFDERVQPVWYEAVCTIARERRVEGLYFWKTDFGVDPTIPPASVQGNLDFTGYPKSEQAIRDCFASDWS